MGKRVKGDLSVFGVIDKRSGEGICSWVMSNSFELHGWYSPGSSVHWILQAIILEWIAVSFSRGSPDPGIKPRSPALSARFFTVESPLKVKVALSCPALWNPMDYIPWNSPGQNTGVFPSSRGSSQPRDRTEVSHMAGIFFTSWVAREAQEYWSGYPIPSPAGLLDRGIEPWSPESREGLKEVGKQVIKDCCEPSRSHNKIKLFWIFYFLFVCFSKADRQCWVIINPNVIYWYGLQTGRGMVTDLKKLGEV